MADIYARIDDERRRITFSLSKECFLAFVAGKTHNELYLPLTENWKRRLFDQGWHLRRSLLDYEVEVKHQASGTTLRKKLTGGSVRMVPLRPFENGGRHIVVYLC